MKEKQKDPKEETKAPSSVNAPTLQVLSGQNTGKILSVVKTCLIGRANDCDLVVPDRKVSRYHMKVIPLNNSLVIQDMDSTNGVYLNGRQITKEEQPQHGDMILLGDTFLTVFLPMRKSHERYGSRVMVTVSTSEETHIDETSNPEKAYKEILREEDLRTVVEIISLARDMQDPGTCFRRILKRLVDLFEADYAVICLASGNEYEPAIIQSREKEIHFLSAIIQKTLEQGRGILVQNLREQLKGTASEKIGKELPPSQMCVPFTDRGKIMGLIALASKQPSRFTRTSLDLLTILANHLAPLVSMACRTDILERVHSVEKANLSHPIIGESEPIKKILRLIDQVAKQPVSILITGETGSGKELVARAVHYNGPNPDGPFISVNCAAIPEDIFEAELFGYEKGAYTGAYQNKPGKFEMSQDGTLFFDEIGELPLPLQAKIMRVLETQEFTRLGANKILRANARFLFATNRNLLQMVKEKKFREDLYFRINSFEIPIPSLREHLEDIPLLVDYILDRIQKEIALTTPLRYTPQVIGAFLAYHWPGNVRELRNVLEQMAILAESGELDESLLPERLRFGFPSSQNEPSEEKGLLHDITSKTHRQIVIQALKKARGEKKKAAKILGISRPTLDKKIKEYGILIKDKGELIP
ncbi:sigma 54-interacting transcriptional regulator [Candidatus Sumerlaeota bacterium]|nr:sigma 54-interacting transcriptional regulator [Candidatus Sumerlaeota bacterium]